MHAPFDASDLRQAVAEIEDLRRDNAAMAGQLRVLDLVERLLNGGHNSPRGFGVDIVPALKREADRLDADEKKKPRVELAPEFDEVL